MQNKISKQEIKALKKAAKEMRKYIFSMIVSAHASHIGSAYSVIDILVYLYKHFLHINPAHLDNPERDRFILSKGWGISALYSVLASRGFFSKKLLPGYCTDGSKLIGCATRNGIPGIEATTGSMGHGLPLGVGMALAGKRQKRKYRTVVIISDGECDEGSTWEASLIAGHHKLSNLIVFIDYNGWQSFGRTKDILLLDPLADKWRAFNWHVQEIDGHDFRQIYTATLPSSLAKNKPNVIIAHTVKGKGLSLLEDRNEWHYQTPREKEIQQAREEGLL